MIGPVERATCERLATEKAILSATVAFEAECWRGDPTRLVAATEAAHVALQAHLDAISSQIAVGKREAWG